MSNGTRMLPPPISLAAARVNANMSQVEVAEAIGVTRNTVISWEKGKTEISHKDMLRLSELYKYPMDFIFIPAI